MENYNWEYVHDNTNSIDTYIDSMTDGSYIDDQYDNDIDTNEWANYYEEVGEIIE